MKSKLARRARLYNLFVVSISLVFGGIVFAAMTFTLLPVQINFESQLRTIIFVFGAINIVHNWMFIYSLSEEEMNSGEYFHADLIVWLTWIGLLAVILQSGEGQEWLTKVYFGGLDVLATGMAVSWLILRFIPQRMHLKELKTHEHQA